MLPSFPATLHNTTIPHDTHIMNVYLHIIHKCMYANLVIQSNTKLSRADKIMTNL